LKITKISGFCYVSTRDANNETDSFIPTQYPRLANNKADNITCNILNTYAADME
jgi:hypothetical protein